MGLLNPLGGLVVLNFDVFEMPRIVPHYWGVTHYWVKYVIFSLFGGCRTDYAREGQDRTDYRRL